MAKAIITIDGRSYMLRSPLDAVAVQKALLDAKHVVPWSVRGRPVYVPNEEPIRFSSIMVLDKDLGSERDVKMAIWEEAMEGLAGPLGFEKVTSESTQPPQAID